MLDYFTILLYEGHGQENNSRSLHTRYDTFNTGIQGFKNLKNLQGRRSEKSPQISKSEGQRQAVLNSSRKLLHFLKVSGSRPSTISVCDRKEGASQELVGKPP